METKQNTCNTEMVLINIIDSMVDMSRKEAAIFSDYTKQVHHLISDAVKKINEEIIMDVGEESSDCTTKIVQSDSLLNLLKKAIDTSKLLNKKINAIIRTIQIEDIAGQVINGQLKRIEFNDKKLNSIQTNVQKILSLTENQKREVFSSIQHSINEILDNKKSNHVAQINLNEGTTELF